MLELKRVPYISVAGKGDPSEQPFADCVEALYSVAYAAKFEYKAKGNDFIVSKLEGLWWYDKKQYPEKTMTGAPSEIPRSDWEYRLLIRIPDFVEKESIAHAAGAVVAKKGLELANEVAFFELEEGLCVQMLHVGPFATESLTLEKMAVFMKENRLGENGLHHEIYLSDFRKTAAERLKTILREPVKTE